MLQKKYYLFTIITTDADNTMKPDIVVSILTVETEHLDLKSDFVVLSICEHGHG